MSNRWGRHHRAYQSPEGKCKDLIEFNGCDKTAHLCWRLRGGLQTRLPEVLVIAQKREVRIEANRRKTWFGNDVVNGAYSSSCKAHDLPRRVLKERSNTIRTLHNNIFQLSIPPIDRGLLARMPVSIARFPGTAARRRTSDGHRCLA